RSRIWHVRGSRNVSSRSTPRSSTRCRSPTTSSPCRIHLRQSRREVPSRRSVRSQACSDACSVPAAPPVRSWSISTMPTGSTRRAYRRTSSAADLDVPATVQSLLAARVDALADSDKLVLQTAAVIGKRFSGLILRSIVGLPTGEVDRSLAMLEHVEFIRGETESEYVFRHPLTQEVAYGSQLLEQRIALHAAVA